jgi:hypothetical protein
MIRVDKVIPIIKAVLLSRWKLVVRVSRVGHFFVGWMMVGGSG